MFSMLLQLMWILAELGLATNCGSISRNRCLTKYFEVKELIYNKTLVEIIKDG